MLNNSLSSQNTKTEIKIRFGIKLLLGFGNSE